MLKLSVVILICSFLVALASAGPTGRIVGGYDAKIGQFKHQISLRQLGSHICGGSIISKNYILTAAHCVTQETSDKGYKVFNPNTVTIRAGTVNQFNGGVIVKVESIKVHKDYKNFLNDVALLKLAVPLTFNENIDAIPLAEDATPDNSDVMISGWGRITTGGKSPVNLKYNILQSISTRKCTVKVGMNASTLICLGHKAGDGACNGDSGGPAVYKGKLVGVAGFVVGGCGSNNPDGYAKVAYHLDWIKQHSDV